MANLFVAVVEVEMAAGIIYNFSTSPPAPLLEGEGSYFYDGDWLVLTQK